MNARMRRWAGATALVLVTTTASMAQESAMNPTSDDLAVRAVVSGFVESWNQHDMQAFASLFAEDADFVNVIGLWSRGRAEIRKGHEAIHATRMKNSHLAADETGVRFLRPDVAIVHVRWELAGESGPNGNSLPPRKGLLTLVTAKTHGKWAIAASQNTDIGPRPNVPDGK